MYRSLPLVISCGDPAGVGLELIFKAWLQRRQHNLPSFVCLADPEYVARQAKFFNLSIPIEIIDCPTKVDNFHKSLPIIALENKIVGKLSKPEISNAAAIIESITRSVFYISQGKARALVTAPINKKNLYQAGFNFPGHTEFLAELSSKFFNKMSYPVMMLAGKSLKTVPLTIHIPLKKVPELLTRQLIIETILIVHSDLKTRFNISSPKLAIAGLNPHAGEDGTLGNEEQNIIIPAVEYLRNEKNISIIGPFPADSLFHEAARNNYDVAIGIYHDQALIPIKTLHFHDAVNVTLGLPFVRTSPDHGTAYDIANKFCAIPDSFIEAIKMADQLSIEK